MQVYLTLVRRELGGYFGSLTGYLVVAVVLLLLGLSFSDMLAKLGAEATDAPATEQFFVTLYFWLILLLTAPIMTMRTFAQEKFSGTYETLMTAPVNDVQVVLAKFTGGLALFAITWSPLLLYIVVVRHYAHDSTLLDPLTLVSTALGMLLIGGLYISMGCLASALSRSQIVAAILSYALGLGVFLLSLRAMVSTPPSGWSARLFRYISMADHMESFAQGVVDTRCLVYYTSVTVFFLFATIKVVESRRWR